VNFSKIWSPATQINARKPQSAQNGKNQAFWSKIAQKRAKVTISSVQEIVVTLKICSDISCGTNHVFSLV